MEATCSATRLVIAHDDGSIEVVRDGRTASRARLVIDYNQADAHDEMERMMCAYPVKPA